MALLLSAADPDAATRGREAFEKRCIGCHSLDRAKVGPPLRHVFGQRAGADPTFQYSDALKKSQVQWDDGTLDRWLSDPDSVVPGNDMSFRLENGDDRRAIIAYLKQLAKG